eukprot:411744-Rhodomonas_salina.1
MICRRRVSFAGVLIQLSAPMCERDALVLEVESGLVVHHPGRTEDDVVVLQRQRLELEVGLVVLIYTQRYR